MNFYYLSTLLALPTLILCESPPLITLPPPPLPECVTPCPLILQPVCGSDGKTYPNECDLSNARCKNPGDDITLKYEGRCEEDCVTPCPLILQPVCGSDGKTYPNECDLSNARCKNPGDDITLKYEGRCEEVCKDVVANCASMLARCDNIAMQKYCKKSCGVCEAFDLNVPEYPDESSETDGHPQLDLLDAPLLTGSSKEEPNPSGRYISGINNKIVRTDSAHINPKLMEFPGARFIGAHISEVDIQGPKGRLGQFIGWPEGDHTGTGQGTSTEFTCIGRDDNNRFYGNPANGCKTFHHCGPGFTDQQVLVINFNCKDGKKFNENTCSCDTIFGNCHRERGCVID